MTGVDLGMDRRPAWWAAAGWVQRALLALVAVGLLWLGVLFGFAYFRLPEPPVPELEGIPVPTALALGGLVLGLVLSGVARVAANVGAGRRRWAARRRLAEAVARVADERVLAPVRAELEAREGMCEAVRRARGRGLGRVREQAEGVAR